jgi:hypothetical protein
MPEGFYSAQKRKKDRPKEAQGMLTVFRGLLYLPLKFRLLSRIRNQFYAQTFAWKNGEQTSLEAEVSVGFQRSKTIVHRESFCSSCQEDLPCVNQSD